jgi:deazaflavin-dependent oxidoreductase (nitroreductase family)
LGIPHPDGVAVVAANYGDARHPGWYHNLKAHSAARVTIEGDTWDATARLATPGEREEIWAKGVELYPGLTKERAWAGDRQIEAFVLTRPEEHVAAQSPRWPMPSGRLRRWSALTADTRPKGLERRLSSNG